jgi:hypothetical protein
MRRMRAIAAGVLAAIGYAIILVAFGLIYLAEGFVRIADWISVEKSPWWGKPLDEDGEPGRFFGGFTRHSRKTPN